MIYINEAKNLPEYQKYKELRIQKLNDIEEIKGELDENDYEEDESDREEIEVEEDTAFSDFMVIDKFTSNLSSSSELYSKLLLRKFPDEKINRKIFNLQRIRSFPAYIFLLDLFKRELPKLQYYSILEMIEVFMLRRHVCEYRTGELEDIFSSLVKIPNENIVEDVREKLKKHLPTDVEFETKFKTHSYKSNGPRAKYVLEVFEYELIEDQGEYTLNKGRELQLEHIIPQKIHTKKSKRKYGDWETYLGENSLDIFTEYIYRIGNLTLLGEKLNIVASNNPYHAKLVEYKKSNIRLTQNIVENYSEFKFDAVVKRSDDFAKMAPKIWSL